VGGRLEADAPEPERKKPRTDDTMEPVFFHSMPVLFYQELLGALNLIGVIDLCPGEGTCAIACMRKMLPYVGIAFNEQHVARLMAHLETIVLSCMVTQGDPFYDVKLADAVKTSSETPAPSQHSASKPLASVHPGPEAASRPGPEASEPRARD